MKDEKKAEKPEKEKLLKEASIRAIDDKAAEVRHIKIALPVEESKSEATGLKNTLRTLSMMLPMAAFSASSCLWGNGTGSSWASTGMLYMYGGMAVMTGLWGIIDLVICKCKEGKKRQIYLGYLQKVEKTIEQQCKEENENLKAVVTLTPDKEYLWNRLPSYPYFTACSLGIGQICASQTELEIPETDGLTEYTRTEQKKTKGKASYSWNSLYVQIKALPDKLKINAPVLVRLDRHSLIGFESQSDYGLQFLTYVLYQLAYFHSYQDVRICLLCSAEEKDKFENIRLLPHCHIDSEISMRLFSSSKDGQKRILSALEEVYNRRKPKSHNSNTDENGTYDEKVQPLPHYVVVCTDSSLIEEARLPHKVAEDPRGFTFIIRGTSRTALPRECGMFWQDNGNYLFNIGDIQTTCEEICKDKDYYRKEFLKIAQYRLPPEQDECVPDRVSLLELYGVQTIDERYIKTKWEENHVWNGISAPIGLKRGSIPFELDISDKQGSHGPHGLIGGTTGSGKSELLKTLILSLAVRYSPEELKFLLIDYKGGGTSDTLKDLPHVAGTVDSQMGINRVGRALQSVKGEIDRREAIFKKANVSSLDELLMKRLPNEEWKIPHLVIVVDEFAELRREHPDFINDLISTAAKGRTLGIHLLLATQDPSTSVKDDILTNVRYIISLRTARPEDSKNLLKKTDAAYLRNVGRCIVKVGSDEIYEEMQSAYSESVYDPNQLSPAYRPLLLDELGLPGPEQPKPDVPNTSNPETERTKILELILKLIKDTKVKSAKPLWQKTLEELSDNEFIKQMKKLSGGKAVCIGLFDDVAEQKYRPLTLDLDQDRGYIFIGPSGSGKTIALQTAILQIRRMYGDEIGILLCAEPGSILRQLCDETITGIDEEKQAENLLLWLTSDIRNRRDEFSAFGCNTYQNYREKCGNDPKQMRYLPLVVVIDGFDRLMDNNNDSTVTGQRLVRILKSCASNGIFILASAKSTHSEDCPSGIRNTFQTIALRQIDQNAYSQTLDVPTSLVRDISVPNKYGYGMGRYNDRENGIIRIMEIRIGNVCPNGDGDKPGGKQRHAGAVKPVTLPAKNIAYFCDDEKKRRLKLEEEAHNCVEHGLKVCLVQWPSGQCGFPRKYYTDNGYCSPEECEVAIVDMPRRAEEIVRKIWERTPRPIIIAGYTDKESMRNSRMMELDEFNGEEL